MTKIEVMGPIVDNGDKWVYDWLGMPATCGKDVTDVLKNATDEVEVHINSNGGDLFAGSEIYTALKDHNGRVTVKVVGMAASAASIIAMAGDKVLISPTAQMMIHNVQLLTGGDYRDLQDASNVAKNANVSVANAYQLKTGKSLDELLALMGEETYVNAQQAVEMGLADEIMFQENTEAPRLVADLGGMLPQAALDRVRNLRAENQKPTTAIQAEDVKKIVAEAISDLKASLTINNPESKKEKPTNPQNAGFERFLF
ncbi:head maturation protease, ClpP-related [Listeria fleischmannii]|uniref:head maturation protease, ClpP-related n=1 Tax=Listeria fleischmannii TaxID=1069827 RepID=UPI0016290F21|nr:head maturation protease, ClpP-related [Listeria fleischmannii]MBC1420107.1 Clp protease ClpP [Listeria fleischmannii]